MNPGNDALAAKGVGASDRTYRHIEGHRHPYVCAVTRKPRLSPGSTFEQHRDHDRIVLDAGIDRLTRPIGERETAALVHAAEFPPRFPRVDDKRQGKRATRKAANARKARRGWR